MFTSNNKILCGKPKEIYSYCRLCANPKTYDEIVDLTTNKEVYDRISRIVNFLKLNFLDLSNAVLPKAACKLCLRSIYSAYVFFVRVKNSQDLLKRVYKKPKTGCFNKSLTIKNDKSIKPKKIPKVKKQTQVGKLFISQQFVDTQKNDGGKSDATAKPTEQHSINKLSTDKLQSKTTRNIENTIQHSIKCDDLSKSGCLHEFLQIKKNEHQSQKCSEIVTKKRKHPTQNSQRSIQIKETEPGPNKSGRVNNMKKGQGNKQGCKKKIQNKKNVLDVAERHKQHITEALNVSENLANDEGIDTPNDPKRRKLSEKPFENPNGIQNGSVTTQNETDIFKMDPIFYLSLGTTPFNPEIQNTDQDLITNDYQTTLIEKDVNLHEVKNGELTNQEQIDELDNIIDLQDFKHTDSFMNLEMEIADNITEFENVDNVTDIIDFADVDDLENVHLENTVHNVESVGGLDDVNLNQVIQNNTFNAQKIANAKTIVNDQGVENLNVINLPGIDTNFTNTQDIENLNVSSLEGFEDVHAINLQDIDKTFSSYSDKFNSLDGINDVTLQDIGNIINFQDINCSIPGKNLNLLDKNHINNAISLQEIENVNNIINVQGIESVDNVLNLEECCIPGDALNLQDIQNVRATTNQIEIINVNSGKTINKIVNHKNIEHAISNQIPKLQGMENLQETDTANIFKEIEIDDGNIMNIQSKVGEASINDFDLQSIENINDVISLEEVEHMVNLQEVNILKSQEVGRVQNFMNLQAENNIMHKVDDILELRELDYEENVVTLNEPDFSWSSYTWKCLHCDSKLADMVSLREHSKETHGFCSGFSCVDCAEQLYTFNAFIEHVRQHRNMLRYYCQFCNERFDTLELCSSHILTHWQRSQEICDRCGEIFTTHDDMKCHKKQYKRMPLPKSYYNVKPTLITIDDDKSWNDYEWACQECFIRLPDPSTLRQHAQEHHNKCFAMKCMDCLRTMSNFRWFVTHVTAHRPYLKHYCPYCNTYFLDINRLHKHEDDHLKGPQKPCHGCGQVFSDNHQMSLHMKRFNSPRQVKDLTTEDLTCDVCDKICPNILSFRKHKKIHGQMTKYICNICGKLYNRSNSLSTHMRTHKGKTEICKLCNKAFCTKYKLRLHAKTHKEERPFVCDDCGTTHKTKSSLRSHIQKHVKKSTYKCLICPRKFKFKDNMRVHMNLHTDTMPFSCEICKKSFSNFSNCDKHMVRMHGVPYAKTKRTTRGSVEINKLTGKAKEMVQNDITEEWFQEIIKPQKPGKKKKDILPDLLTDFLN